MAIRLGDLLVKQGLITEQQLEEALRNQEMFGGRLGTNLVELGYVTERVLAKLLSEQLHIPCAEAAEFDQIAPAALAAITREHVEKHKVIPLGLANRQLRLAMSDPTDLRVVDELAFSTGLAVKPVVAPELLITYAMERYYGIARSTRYLRVAGAADAEFQVVQAGAALAEANAAAHAAGVLVERRDEFFDQGRRTYVEQRFDLVQAAKTLVGVQTQDEVLEVARRYLAADFRQALVLVLHGDVLVGWEQAGAPIGPKELRRVAVPLAKSTFFRLVHETRYPSVGRAKLSPADQWLFKTVGLAANEDVLCLPLLVNQQVVGMLLGVGPLKGQAGDLLADYDTLTKKLSYAFQILLLRRRILGQ